MSLIRSMIKVHYIVQVHFLLRPSGIIFLGNPRYVSIILHKKNMDLGPNSFLTQKGPNSFLTPMPFQIGLMTHKEQAHWLTSFLYHFIGLHELAYDLYFHKIRNEAHGHLSFLFTVSQNLGTWQLGSRPISLPTSHGQLMSRINLA